MYKEKLKKLIEDRLVKIPHGVDLTKFYPKEKTSEKFTFLCNKGLRNMEDRGGIQYLIKAYLEEFTEKDNVELIIKINPAYGVPNLLLMFPELKDTKLSVKYIHDNLKYEELVNLYSQCDVFVSPTRAEAFNIPCLEALACGKPVITTNYGGQTDFCTEENSFIIGGELTEVKRPMEDYSYEGIKWLTPDMNELKRALRAVYKIGKFDQDKYLDKARQFTWENSAKKVVDLI